jgi:hypothetical protein
MLNVHFGKQCSIYFTNTCDSYFELSGETLGFELGSMLRGDAEVPAAKHLVSVDGLDSACCLDEALTIRARHPAIKTVER